MDRVDCVMALLVADRAVLWKLVAWDSGFSLLRWNELFSFGPTRVAYGNFLQPVAERPDTSLNGTCIRVPPLSKLRRTWCLTISLRMEI